MLLACLIKTFGLSFCLKTTRLSKQAIRILVFWVGANEPLKFINSRDKLFCIKRGFRFFITGESRFFEFARHEQRGNARNIFESRRPHHPCWRIWIYGVWNQAIGCVRKSVISEQAIFGFRKGFIHCKVDF